MVIYYLDSALTFYASNFLDEPFERESNIYIISKIELLGWNPPQGKSLRSVEKFVKKANILPLTEAVVSKTIEIRRNYKIKLPDAIIASTAIIYDMSLITKNTSDFNKITDLRILHPDSL